MEEEQFLFVAYYPVISQPGLFLELFPNIENDDDDIDESYDNDVITNVVIDANRLIEQLDDDYDNDDDDDHC